MLCAMNIGNTHVTVVVKDKGERIVCLKTYETNQCRSVERFQAVFTECFHGMDVAPPVIVASVVSHINDFVTEALAQLYSSGPIWIDLAVFDALGFDYSNYDSSILGIDRMLCSYVVRCHYELPAVVIDSGTATTLNVIDREGRFLGGTILPGIFLWTQSLCRNTALLPDTIDINATSAIGRNTEECISIGALQGAGLIIDGLIRKFGDELACSVKSVVATGGGATYILPHCDTNIVYRKGLVVDGIFLAHQQFASVLSPINRKGNN